MQRKLQQGRSRVLQALFQYSAMDEVSELFHGNIESLIHYTSHEFIYLFIYLISKRKLYMQLLPPEVSLLPDLRLFYFIFIFYGRQDESFIQNQTERTIS